MKQIVHRVAGVFALLLIASFWLSTIASEISGRTEVIYLVKRSILMAMALLIPALMITAGSGFSLAGKRVGRLIDAKKTRMPLIALNGLLILVPSAVFLWWKAERGDFDTWFVVVQASELIAGAVNITLISLNVRDGIRLSKFRARAAERA